MRWERLFADLEAQGDDAELLERDALVEDLREEEVAGRSWRDGVGSRVQLDVLGAGRLEGRVLLVTEQLVRLAAGRLDHVVAGHAVTALIGDGGPTPPSTAVAQRLGWGAVLRAARDDGSVVRLVRTTGQALTGTVEAVGADAVVLRSGDRRVTIVLEHLAVLTLGVDDAVP